MNNATIQRGKSFFHFYLTRASMRRTIPVAFISVNSFVPLFTGLVFEKRANLSKGVSGRFLRADAPPRGACVENNTISPNFVLLFTVGTYIMK